MLFIYIPPASKMGGLSILLFLIYLFLTFSEEQSQDVTFLILGLDFFIIGIFSIFIDIYYRKNLNDSKKITYLSPFSGGHIYYIPLWIVGFFSFLGGILNFLIINDWKSIFFSLIEMFMNIEKEGVFFIFILFFCLLFPNNNNFTMKK